MSLSPFLSSNNPITPRCFNGLKDVLIWQLELMKPACFFKHTPKLLNVSYHKVNRINIFIQLCLLAKVRWRGLFIWCEFRYRQTYISSQFLQINPYSFQPSSLPLKQIQLMLLFVDVTYLDNACCAIGWGHACGGSVHMATGHVPVGAVGCTGW